MSLFNLHAAPVTLHSGGRSPFLIDCDALTDADLAALAWLAYRRLPPFGSVVGVPRGGLRFAEALDPYCRCKCGVSKRGHGVNRPVPTCGGCDDFRPSSAGVLIADDVLTTGASMEAFRVGFAEAAAGVVIFSRTKVYPAWITVLCPLEVP